VNVRKKRILSLVLVSVILAASGARLVLREAIMDIPAQVTVTVAWNPYSIADDMIRAMAGNMNTQVTLQNITGANGANGANAVWNTERDGTNLLSTSLSAFVTSEAMGFAESSHRDWVVWLCAFSPAVVVVAADSPYHTIEDLIAAARQNPGRLRCANPGSGTVGFVAAELFRTRSQLEFEHVNHAGNNPAINALLDGEADFAVLLSTEAAGRLQSAELRTLETNLQIGEYYGLFTPADVQDNRLRGLDALINLAIESEAFAVFLRGRELVPVAPDRKQSGEITEHHASLLCWTLYDAGYLPTKPDRLGVGRR
jgi:tripartite-type tricarboxylate transporter receptor subunit TctC